MISKSRGSHITGIPLLGFRAKPLRWGAGAQRGAAEMGPPRLNVPYGPSSSNPNKSATPTPNAPETFRIFFDEGISLAALDPTQVGDMYACAMTDLFLRKPSV